jgi:hypothetical protein
MLESEYEWYRTRVLIKFIQNVPGGEVNILGSHSVGHSNQKNVWTFEPKKCICACVLFRTVSEIYSMYRRGTRHVLTILTFPPGTFSIYWILRF